MLNQGNPPLVPRRGIPQGVSKRGAIRMNEPMKECHQCGDEWPRNKMLSLDSWIDPPENPDVVCLRCASVAMKGGPENMTEQERDEHNIIVENAE